MQFDFTDVKLMKHPFDAILDGRIVSAVAGDKFRDHGPR